MSKIKASRSVWRWTWVSCALVLLVWGAESLVAERTAVTTFLLYMPQLPWAFSPAVLCVWCLWRRDWRAMGANLAGLGLVMVTLLGFNVPWHRDHSGGAGLRVLTYNTHYTEGGIHGVAQTIRAENADVVCLQETPQVTGSGERWVDVMGRRFAGWRLIQAGEVTTMTKLPVLAERHWTLPGSGRVLLETVVRTPAGALAVFNVHLDNAYKDPALVSAIGDGRLAQAVQDSTRGPAIRLAQWGTAEPVLSRCQGPFVLAGDFNNPPRGELYGEISRLARDGFREAGWGCGYSFPSGVPLMRIDYVWLGNGVRARSARVVRSRASDHRPLLVTVAF